MSSVGVKNQIITDTGYVRTLLISKKTNKIANVWRVDRNTAAKHRTGTWQQAQTGDLAITSVINKHTGKLIWLYRSIFITPDSEVTFRELPTNFNMLVFQNNIDKTVTDWLNSFEDVYSLPAGVGWDGKYTEIELNKLDTALSKLPEKFTYYFPEDIVRIKDAVYYTAKAEFEKEPKVLQFDNDGKFNCGLNDIAIVEHVMDNDETTVEVYYNSSQVIDSTTFNGKITKIVLVNFKTIPTTPGATQVSFETYQAIE